MRNTYICTHTKAKLQNHNFFCLQYRLIKRW